MSVTKKHINVGDTKVFDPEIIYARAMGFQSSTRSLAGILDLSHIRNVQNLMLPPPLESLYPKTYIIIIIV